MSLFTFSQELSKTLTVCLCVEGRERKKMVRERGITVEPAPILIVFRFNVAWKHVMMAECCGYILD